MHYASIEQNKTVFVLLAENKTKSRFTICQKHLKEIPYTSKNDLTTYHFEKLTKEKS